MGTTPDTLARAPVLNAVHAAVERALLVYAGGENRPDATPVPDAGPAVLAGLAGTAVDHTTAEATLARWLRSLQPDSRHAGLFDGGIASALIGLRGVGGVAPGLTGLADSIRAALVRHLAQRPWRTTGVGWSDYDLITGPAGTLIALVNEPECSRADIAPAVAHLAWLCRHDNLDGLRVGQYRDDPDRGWNHGRLNGGLAHGVPGVTAALCAAADRYGPDAELADALGRTARWLAAEAYTEPSGLVTWPLAGREGRHPLARRSGTQAWCYGTPGVAWTLWEAGRVLDDTDLSDLARRAFESYLALRRLSDPLPHRLEGSALSRTDLLALCHGAAGVMLICDAFHRHAGLAEAGERQAEWQRLLLGHLDDLVEGMSEDPSLMQGMSGALAALLTVQGLDRSWLPLFGLR